MEARQEIADFVAALIFVYTICIIAWIVAQFVFSLGARVPYNRAFSAVLDFLRDVSEPYLRIFRRFIPPLGPLDLSPMIGLFLLYIVGGLLADAIRG
jgi:YggT family protein